MGKCKYSGTRQHSNKSKTHFDRVSDTWDMVVIKFAVQSYCKFHAHPWCTLIGSQTFTHYWIHLDITLHTSSVTWIGYHHYHTASLLYFLISILLLVSFPMHISLALYYTLHNITPLYNKLQSITYICTY